jgi:haloalkane dehalogenase
MLVLRTPTERFSTVPDFPYSPSYVDAGDGLRMAYVAAGPEDAPVVVLLHGEPTWSFLWRSVIPVLTGAGLRVVAPDLIGFGRSDKPAEVGSHSFAGHIEWVRAALFDALDLHDVTLVGHDWGGLIGLRLLAEHGDRIAAFVATNTGLPTGDQPMPDVWLRFRETVRSVPVLGISRLVGSGCQVRPPDAVLHAYDAPFPDETYKAAPRAMPGLVPTTADDPAAPANRAAWQKLSRWDKPFLVAFNGDPITGALGPVLARTVPGARSVAMPGLGHFLQEDSGPLLGTEIAHFVSAIRGPEH